MLKWVPYIMPCISVAFMIFFPAALQLYFLTTTIFASAQGALFLNPRFRDYAGFPKEDKSHNSITDAASSGRSPSLPLRTQSNEMKKELDKELNEAKKAKLHKEKNKDISYIDRIVEKAKNRKTEFQRDFKDGIKRAMDQKESKRADGTTAPEPRLSKEDLSFAENYEKTRRQEDEWDREEKNRALREAYYRALEEREQRQRSKRSKPSWMDNEKSSKKHQ